MEIIFPILETQFIIILILLLQIMEDDLQNLWYNLPWVVAFI